MLNSRRDNPKQPFVKGHRIQTAATPENCFSSVAYRPWDIFGQIAIGNRIRAQKMEDGVFRVIEGKVCYIHPKRRYFTVHTDAGWRECMWFPQEEE